MKLFICLLILLFCSDLRPIENQLHLPNEFYLKPKNELDIQLSNGKPIFIKWNDKRKASIQLKHAPQDEMSFNYKIEQNDCTPHRGQLCHLNFKVKVIQVDFVWVEHPQKEKVGKTLINLKAKKELMGKTYYNFTNMAFDPTKLDKSFPTLSCNEYTWIPGGQITTPPDLWTILQWSSEELRMNKETNVFENQGNSGGLNLTFKKNEHDLFELREIPYLFLAKQSVFPLFSALFAETITIVTKNTKNEICQISFKGDMVKMRNDIESYHKKLESSGRPFIYGEDKNLFETPLVYTQGSIKEILDEMSSLNLE